MADGTKIEWTEATWNPITGCSVKSPGCAKCYAMKLAGTRLQHHPSRAGLTVKTKTGPVWNGEVRFNERWLDQPLQWTKPRKIFVVAHGDLFHENVPEEWIAQVFNVMARCPQHKFQILTKRIDRAADILGSPKNHALWSPKLWHRSVLSNVWIGTSVEDQTRADERREPLRAIANMRWHTWVSYEPALGHVNWTDWHFIHWLVSGGESGPNARPSHPDWHRKSRDWCVAAGVPFFFKQWGNYTDMKHAGIVEHGPVTNKTGNVRDWINSTVTFSDGSKQTVSAHSWTGHGTDLVFNVGKKRAGALLDGREWREFPR